MEPISPDWLKRVLLENLIGKEAIAFSDVMWMDRVEVKARTVVGVKPLLFQKIVSMFFVHSVHSFIRNEQFDKQTKNHRQPIILSDKHQSQSKKDSIYSSI